MRLILVHSLCHQWHLTVLFDVLRLQRVAGHGQAVKEPKCFLAQVLHDHLNELLRAPASKIGERAPTPNSPLPPQEIATPSPYRQGAGGWPLAPRTTAPARYPPRGLGRLTKHVTRVSCATGIHPHNHCEGDRPARGLWVRYPPPTITEKGVVTSSSGHSAAGPRFTMEQKQSAQVEL